MDRQHMFGYLAEHRFGEYLLRVGNEVAYTVCGPADVVWRSKGSLRWRSAQVKKTFQHRGDPCVELRHRDRDTRVRYMPEDSDYVACVKMTGPRTEIWLIPMIEACKYSQLHLNESRRMFKVWPIGGENDPEWA